LIVPTAHVEAVPGMAARSVRFQGVVTGADQAPLARRESWKLPAPKFAATAQIAL
jgi:hypothetical protein